MTETTSGSEAQTPQLIDAPEDAPEASATGYAVYDRTIGQYVGGVTKDKPSNTAASKLVRKGHTAAVVRV